MWVVFFSVDNRARAEAGRSQHPGLGEEQEGVHRAHGEVADRAGGGAADGEPGQRLLRGQRSLTLACCLAGKSATVALTLHDSPGGGRAAGVGVRRQGAGAGDRRHGRDRPVGLEEQHRVQRR